jgi:cell division cycle 2-like
LVEDNGRTTMAGVSTRLAALCAKIRGLEAPGTDMALRRMSMACICIAMHDLGNAAVPSSSRTTKRTRKYPTTPMTTSRFAVGEGRLLSQDSLGYETKVRHRTSGKSFAMKTPFPLPDDREHGDEEEKASVLNLRVLREACFMASCRGHPSLVSFYAVCRNPLTERYGLVTEHVGPSLHSVLTCRRNGKPFPEDEVRCMMRQILSGAKAMHDRGIVHLNIDMENVLVGGTGGHDTIAVKIGHFGQAACMSERDLLLCIRSFSYLAPEVLLRGRGAFRSEVIDSWSTGCLMAELLTGRVLFVDRMDPWDDDEVGQLREIFHVCGVPDEETVEDIKPQDRRLVKLVRKWRARRRRAGTLQRDSWLRGIVPRDVLSDDGLEVLQGLLACNPKKRLTAGAALQLPWLANDFGSSPGAAGALRPRPFTWLLLSVLALLLFFVVFVCVVRR